MARAISVSMLETIHIIIPGKPDAWSRPRVSSRYGKVIMFDPKASKRANLARGIKQHFPFLIYGPVKVEIFAFFANKTKEKWGEFKNTRCDLDNISKNILDTLNRIAFADDAQVACLYAEKKWASKNETHVIVSRL